MIEEMIAFPMNDDDLKIAKRLLSIVENDSEHEDQQYAEIEFLHDVWMIVMATWDELLGEAYYKVYNESDLTDEYWFDIDEFEEKGYLDVGGDYVVRFCKVV